MNFKEYTIQDTNKCKCGYEFTLKDLIKLEKINEHGFYANIVKNYSKVKCPECNNEALLLLKQKGQTWEIMGLAISKQISAETTQIENNEVIEENQEYICPECKKVCKSQIGLNAHIKSHQK